MKKVLFIGGTGIISSACSRLALERGIDLYHLNRGQSQSVREVKGVKQIVADIRDPEAARVALEGHQWDSVVDWISFVPEHLQVCLDLFRGKTGQFVFISSASAYQTPPLRQPVTEDTPLDNPFWEYSRNKIACERFLEKAYADEDFPYTVVRPSHTYDKTLLIGEGGYTALKRVLDGKPCIVHGDGTSLWTITNHRDFAKGLVGLLAHPDAIAQAYHITSDEWLPWNQIWTMTAKAFGVDDIKLLHVPSDIMARYDADMGASLLGDKTHSMIFDNSKIKALVPDFKCTIPFSEGVLEIAEFYKTHPERCKEDSRMAAVLDRIEKDWTR
ncbi:MAG: NAD-dependent epimerase/dehydratase family protein [Opitutales bacterium]|jgi:nucleoside-diphosphate-sugar epimerase